VWLHCERWNTQHVVGTGGVDGRLGNAAYHTCGHTFGMDRRTERFRELRHSRCCLPEVLYELNLDDLILEHVGLGSHGHGVRSETCWRGSCPEWTMKKFSLLENFNPHRKLVLWKMKFFVTSRFKLCMN